ncbi:hypothetical protein [Bacillus sp. FJAT-29937]|uniref:hypothetical protein n=1 Tax=Bacillus sp. FJAT-29937 TaxID=1720553 RepID=UPI0008328826|nr:hypothetical protein [Bacillus sp. FJAT-29937]
MNEKTNDIRSNLIFLMYKIYSILKEKQLSSSGEWLQEDYSLTWDGQQTLILFKKSLLIAEVRTGQVNLDPSIQEYYHVPYSWLLNIKDLLGSADNTL